MATKFKREADSAGEATRIMRGAGKPIVPPSNVPLDKGDLPFFVNIIDEFARADWSPHQLELAALLARSMNDIAVEQMLLRDEGAVVPTEKGYIVNPRRSVIQLHMQNILGLRRTLALHAASRGEAEHLGNRIAIAKAIQDKSPSLSDELISRA